VTFVCDANHDNATLSALGEIAPRRFGLNYKSRCACLGLCDPCAGVDPSSLAVKFSLRTGKAILATDPLGYVYSFSCDGVGLPQNVSVCKCIRVFEYVLTVFFGPAPAHE
jgi:hypothetical protein